MALKYTDVIETSKGEKTVQEFLEHLAMKQTVGVLMLQIHKQLEDLKDNAEDVVQEILNDEQYSKLEAAVDACRAFCESVDTAHILHEA